MSFGINTIFEDRTGGDIQYIKGKGDSTHSYFEENKSSRFSTQLSFDHQFNQNSSLSVKNSVNNFNRTITIPGYTFDGRQWSAYSEITYNNNREKSGWVAALNLYTDDFKEYPKDAFPKRNYTQNTIGGFIQNTWKASRWLQLETGARGDYVADYGFVFLPRVSALFKLSPQLTSRMSGGFGYKTPTIFTEETERLQFKSVLPVNPAINKLENSYGANFDLSYRLSLFDKVSANINQLFFYTRINRLLVPDTIAGNSLPLNNSTGFISSKGFETNLKLSYNEFKLYIGYTFTDAHLKKMAPAAKTP